MPSRVRLLLKHYPLSGSGWNVYRGGDVVRYLEHVTGIKIPRPFTSTAAFTELNKAVNTANMKKNTLKGVCEVFVWRVQRGAQSRGYNGNMQAGQVLLRCPASGKLESPRKAIWKPVPKKTLFYEPNVIARLVEQEVLRERELREMRELERDF